jgi:acetolactate synthase-1/2/3 large subunit
VHLSIPIEVSDALVDDGVAIPAPASLKPVLAPERDIEAALDLLEKAERPVMIAGSGVFWAGAGDSLRRFAELTQVPCFTIGIGRGVLSDEHPLCFGSADPILNVTAVEIKDADVVLLIGKRIDFRLAYGQLFGPAAALIHVDIHAAELGRNRPARLPIHGDALETLDQLVRAGASRKGWKERPWVGRLREVKRGAVEARRADERSDEAPVHPLRLLKEVERAAGEDVIWAIDGGDFAQWCRIALPVKKPGHWLRLGPMGTVGAAIPFGIAAKLAKPESPVIVLTGDGGMGFHSWEIHTALRFKLPIVVIVGNDQGWGMERALQAGFYNRTIGVELGPMRYDKVVEAMGGHGEHVEHPAELGPAIERALKAGRAACVNVMMRGLASPLTEANLAASKKPQS